jgi:hypothetical protein
VFSIYLKFFQKCVAFFIFLCFNRDMEATATTATQTEEVTMSTATFTHGSYAEAQKALKANKRIGSSASVTWDAGDGFTGVGYYCPRRNRIIVCAEQDGFKIF